MRKKTESLLYSAGGLVAALIILVLLNLVLGAARGRIDLTQGKLYTLSEGTRAFLGKLESPVRSACTSARARSPCPSRRTGVGRGSARGVQAGRPRQGHSREARSPAGLRCRGLCDSGRRRSQVTPSGDKFYLGASISYADQKLALPALTPDREPLLEYDLVRAIARATVTSKPVIGVMSALPVFGMPPSP